MPDRLPSDLTSGFEQMDAQHAAILRTLRQAQAAARSGDVASVRQALSALSHQLVAHFDAEDAWMAGAGYPERSRHGAAHDLFLRDMASVGPALASGLVKPVLDWLSERAPEWLAFHIRVNDLPLGRYLTTRAARPGSSQAGRPRCS